MDCDSADAHGLERSMALVDGRTFEKVKDVKAINDATQTTVVSVDGRVSVTLPAKHGIFSVQMWLLGIGKEKLRSIRVGSTVGH